MWSLLSVFGYNIFVRNIIDYVNKYGDLSFQEKPFNNVDVVVFASLVYIEFEAVAPKHNEPKKAPFYIRDSFPEKLTSNCIDGKKHIKLLNALKDSKRYKDVSIQYVLSIFDNTVLVEQFCAMTFDIPDVGYLVAFRGTDNSKEGWEEDIGTGLTKATSGQLDSVEYLRIVYKNLKNKHFMICGHSKGGNLALYSALYSHEDVYKNIDKVYSLDGNGFADKSFFDLDSYKYLKDNLISIVPKDSVVGEILYGLENPIIVQAEGVFIIQHSTYFWEVNLEKGDFFYTDRLSFSSRVRHRAITKWYDKRTKNQKLLILYLLFNTENEYKDGVIKTIYENKKTLTKEENAELKGVFSSFFSYQFEAFFYYLVEALRTIKKKTFDK